MPAAAPPPETPARAKRFYTRAAAEPAGDGYRVTLDGRPLRTPAGAPLDLPTAGLAEAVAAEWEAQEEHIRPDRMPLMRLAATAVDRTGPERAAIVAALAAYAETDLLCYRAESPAELAARQEAAWHPLLAWAEEALGAPLVVTRGVLPVPQPADSLRVLTSAVEELDDLALTALQSAVPVLGSLVLGLALVSGRVDAAQAFGASRVDEDYQAELWGEDAEAAARARRMAEDVAAARRFVELAGRGREAGD